MSLSPIVAEGLPAGRIVVGVAESLRTATGLSIDPTDLDVAFPFRETKETRIVSVSPLLQDGQATFTVLREDHPIKQGRAVDSTRDFLFGLSESGFVRQPIGGGVELVWAADVKTNITDPRVASISNSAHAVAFRQGGQTGAIMLGWLKEDGQSLTTPFRIPTAVGFVGNPSIGACGGRALVVFAGRISETAAWSLFSSLVEQGQPPSSVVPLEPPPGGPGGDSIAPAVACLSENRWLLQWSEGTQGQRQVRIQTLDVGGHPIGISTTVSPLGTNSGQGVLWSEGNRAVSLFMVSVGRSAELWAAPINCSE
jgi:hypothetical protein